MALHGQVKPRHGALGPSLAGESCGEEDVVQMVNGVLEDSRWGDVEV